MNFRVYYDEESVNEGAKILYHYNKTINKKNINKIKASYRYYDWPLIILIVLLVITSSALFYIIRYEEPDTLTITYNVVLYLFIWFVFFYKIINQLSSIKKTKEEVMQPTTISINETEIRINRTKDPFFMLWTDLKEVAINPHCVLLIPKRKNEKAIILPIDYKDEIIRTCQRLDLTGLIHNYVVNK